MEGLSHSAAGAEYGTPRDKDPREKAFESLGLLREKINDVISAIYAKVAMGDARPQGVVAQEEEIKKLAGDTLRFLQEGAFTQYAIPDLAHSASNLIGPHINTCQRQLEQIMGGGEAKALDIADFKELRGMLDGYRQARNVETKE
jgi:hypothetical protein